MKIRYFMNSDGDIFRIEYVTKKEMLSLMKDANIDYYEFANRTINGYTDNYFDAVAVETKEAFRLSEEVEKKEAVHIIRSIERQRNINIVNENAECYIVYGAVDINEHGVVVPSETIADNIDSSISEITEAEVEEIFEAERRIAEAKNQIEEEKRASAVEATASEQAEEAEQQTAEQVKETIEASEASESEKAMKEQKKQNSNIKSVIMWDIRETKLNSSCGITVYYNSDRSRSFSCLSEATASVKKFVAEASAVAVSISYKHCYEPTANYTYYATEEAIEEAEEAEEKAIEQAKADARFYTAKRGMKYTFEMFYYGADITKYIYRVKTTATEEAEKAFSDFCERLNYTKLKKQEQEQKKAETAEAEAKAEEIAEAIEATEDSALLIRIAEQATEAEYFYLHSNFDTYKFLKLAEQAKAKAKATASAEQAKIIKIEEAIEEAETIRHYSEMFEDSEKIKVLDSEIEALKNRLNTLKAEQAEEQEQEQAEEEASEAIAEQAEEQEQKKLLKLNKQFFAERRRTAEEEQAEDKNLYIVSIEYRNKKHAIHYGIATKAEAFSIANSDSNIIVSVLERTGTEEASEAPTAEEEASEQEQEQQTAPTGTGTAEEATATAFIYNLFQLFLYWIKEATATAEQKKKQKLLKVNMQYFSEIDINFYDSYLYDYAYNICNATTNTLKLLNQIYNIFDNYRDYKEIAEAFENNIELLESIEAETDYLLDRVYCFKKMTKEKAEQAEQTAEQEK